MTDCRLYLITPPRIDDADAFARALQAALTAGGETVAALQIRLKDVDEAHIRAVTRVLTPIAHAQGAAVLMNDHVMLAKELGLGGVHVVS